jgi:hypothetical protein
MLDEFGLNGAVELMRPVFASHKIGQLVAARTIDRPNASDSSRREVFLMLSAMADNVEKVAGTTSSQGLYHAAIWHALGRRDWRTPPPLAAKHDWELITSELCSSVARGTSSMHTAWHCLHGVGHSGWVR